MKKQLAGVYIFKSVIMTKFISWETLVYTSHSWTCQSQLIFITHFLLLYHAKVKIRALCLNNGIPHLRLGYTTSFQSIDSQILTLVTTSLICLSVLPLPRGSLGCDAALWWRHSQWVTFRSDANGIATRQSCIYASTRDGELIADAFIEHTNLFQFPAFKLL